MPNPTYFVQDCPTCGRRLQIRVEYLGKKVVCQHCRGPLTACDPASNRYPAESDYLLHRAEQLLKDAANSLSQKRTYNRR